MNPLNPNETYAKNYQKIIRRVFPDYESIITVGSQALSAHEKEECNILIVGAGIGNEIPILLAQKPKVHITAQEPNAFMFAELSSKYHHHSQVSLTTKNIKDLPPQKYHFIYANLLLHFLAQQEMIRLLKEIHSLAGPKSKLITSYLKEQKNKKETTKKIEQWKNKQRSHKISEEIINQIHQDIAIYTHFLPHQEESIFLNAQWKLIKQLAQFDCIAITLFENRAL